MASHYPGWLLEKVQSVAPHLPGQYAAQILWQRGLRDPAQLDGFLSADCYQPTPPSAFGEEMKWAVERILQARDKQETVTIWGDFDADGVTATAVLWEGLGQFLNTDQLDYVIPNRLTDSHGLNSEGIHSLKAQGTDLIITCDTGCTNLAEINLANELGIDVIVTDHHTLLPFRPNVVALINPRNFESNHPLATLSGVAVAYKLIEALYQSLPNIPQQPLEELLDLVAIGLIADLVELRGDCRYLAQMGLRKLKTRLADPMIRPGVSRLLELCNKKGDRPTDISFGIGPRINAVSRIKGDASFCVELLTSRDVQRCRELADETELANDRRKALQLRIKKEAIAELEKIDLSTTEVIAIAKRQWPVGVLGLVAGELAKQCDRPVILLTLEDNDSVAKGSARSVHGIDLYKLMQGQSHLFTKFGGHPFAAGLSLPTENLPLLRQGLNQAFRTYEQDAPQHDAAYDLEVTVKELGKELFKELQLLEPYGMGHPAPKLMIRNCWFEDVFNQNIKDRKGRKLKYIKAEFTLWDDSVGQGFPGIWWEHYKEDFPRDHCNVICEIDFNNFHRRYEIRILDVEPVEVLADKISTDDSTELPEIIDYRNVPVEDRIIPQNALVMNQCPKSWNELSRWVQRSRVTQRALVLTYQPHLLSPTQTYQTFIGIVKWALDEKKSIDRAILLNNLQISDQTLIEGVHLLQELGISVDNSTSNQLSIAGQFREAQGASMLLQSFLEHIQEERFQMHFFETLSCQAMKVISNH